jgi:hypothetical protein
MSPRPKSSFPAGKFNLPPALEPFAPWACAVFKLLVSVFFVYSYVDRYIRVMYIADGPARGIEAYRLAFAGFRLFPQHQFAPLPLWLWAALLKIVPDIYFTGTALNVVAGAGVAAFMYLLGRKLAGSLGGAVAAAAYIFSPVHHNLTLSEGMAEPTFYLFLTAGIYLAAVGADADDNRGSWGAGFLFAAAALCRYEAALFLILYAGYRLARGRPARWHEWLAWAAPLALAGVFLAAKAFQPHSRGLWPALGGVHADTSRVLTNPVWYRRLGYGVWRMLFDGRATTVLGFAGAALVFGRRRTAGALVEWGAWAVIFAALTVIAVAVGIGFCPERYFATPLLLLFPFAGLAVVSVAEEMTTPIKKIAGTAILVAAALITARWDAAILKPGYGYQGPSETRPTFAAETALTLRELWRRGELAPEELVLIEKGDRLNEEYPLRAYTDHPLNFERVTTSDLRRKLEGLTLYMNQKRFRVAIILSEENRAAFQRYYAEQENGTVIFANPTHTIVVRPDGWRHIPPFASRVRPDVSAVYEITPGRAAVTKPTPGAPGPKAPPPPAAEPSRP